MKFPLHLLPAATLAGLLAAGPAASPVAAQTPTETPLAENQGPLLEEALERYRAIEERGGWGVLKLERAMGQPFEYECTDIAALEKRLIAEGYLERHSPPPPPPPMTPEQQKQAARAKERAKNGKGEQPPAPPAMCPYTPALTEAVRAFQADRKILGDGQVGALTRQELNRPVEDIVDLLEHDVERWRGYHLSPTGTYLLVNIPFFELSAFAGGEEEMRMKVVVGQKDWPTPLLSDQVEYMIVNPDWGIPERIAKLEYWPSAKRDPKWLSRQGITAEGGSLRQKPGPQNPLGRIKFVMPNDHDVYLHDTPYKGAFNAVVRTLSHGCVRLSQPVDLAAYLLRDQSSWDRRRVEAAIASKQTKQIQLSRPMPVHIVYSTTRVNAAGRLEVRPDVYGKNRSRRRDASPSREDGDGSVDNAAGNAADPAVDRAVDSGPW